jgi:hypothetical protein
MNAIHCPRAIIHQRPLLQPLPGRDEKFPRVAKRFPDFFKIVSTGDVNRIDRLSGWDA